MSLFSKKNVVPMESKGRETLCDAFTECNKVLGLMITEAFKQEATRLFQGRRDRSQAKNSPWAILSSPEQPACPVSTDGESSFILSMPWHNHWESCLAYVSPCQFDSCLKGWGSCKRIPPRFWRIFKVEWIKHEDLWSQAADCFVLGIIGLLSVSMCIL